MLLFSEGGHHTPLIVEFINHYLSEPVYNFEMNYIYPAVNWLFTNQASMWLYETWLFRKLGIHLHTPSPEAIFGPDFSPENAIPWYTIMFVIACILTMAVIWMLKGKLSEDDPSNGQLTLEAGFLALKDLTSGVIGEHAFKYFPVIATFAILILISNLMGLFPLFMAPTASINVTLALGVTSFIYYTYVGIRENGLLKYLAHFSGPKLPFVMSLIITPLIFLIEIFSNLIRPGTLGIRLFANMYADEQVASIISGLAPPFTQFLVPVVLLPLALFIAVVQTFVFTLLSTIYLSEVTHHDDHGDHGHHDEAHHAETPAVAHA